MSKIHGITGEKGGVGKSLIALAIAEQLRKRGDEFVICETDRSNGDVGNAFDGKREVIRPYFVEDVDQIDQADQLLDVALRGVDIVMNTPAQSHRPIAKWLSLGSADLALSEGVQLYFWFVTSGERDSVNLFIESLQEFQGIPHILIRNEHFTDRLTYDYSDPNTWPAIKEAVDTYQVPVITFPRLGPADIDFMKAHALTFGEALEPTSGLSIGGRSRIFRALNTLFAQLDALEVFKTHEPPQPERTTAKRGRKKRAVKANSGDDGLNGDAENGSPISSDGSAG
ncbi:MAG: hypothetical protein AAGA75_08940 [Cyanobacteria bacterium P01_E01_bin.6]